MDEDQGKYKFEVLPPPVVDGSVTNMQEVDLSKQDHPKWMRDMWSEKVQAVDKNVIDKELEARLESRPRAGPRAARRGALCDVRHSERD